MNAVECASGEGRAKLVLFGEHAAVYGYPAVGCSLRSRTRVEIELRAGGEWKFPHSSAQDERRLRRLISVFQSVVPGFGVVRGGQVNVASSIPRNLGFGSSAALCAAIASALARIYGNAARDQTTWNWAHEAERLFHGTPSGIDTGLSLRKGPFCFSPDPPGLPIARELRGFPMNLVVGAAPRHMDSRSLIASIRRKVEADDLCVVNCLRELGEVAKCAVQLLEEVGNWSGATAAIHNAARREFGELARQAHVRIAELGLSTQEMDTLLDQGMRAGALGGKLSGAGAGGAFFLVCHDAPAAYAVCGAIRAAAGRMRLSTGATIRALRW